jgi:hypothetical protein
LFNEAMPTQGEYWFGFAVLHASGAAAIEVVVEMNISAKGGRQPRLELLNLNCCRKVLMRAATEIQDGSSDVKGSSCWSRLSGGVLSSQNGCWTLM